MIEQSMLGLLATLRALFQVHQNAHWLSRGVPSYGDHLLFQRLYEGIADEIDGLAEKMIGVYDIEIEVMQQADQVADIMTLFESQEDELDLASRSLRAETLFLEFLQRVYDRLEEAGELTMGLDDFLPAVASLHETHVYLLKQRTKAR